ncbi:MAG: hypothetical protein CSA70_03215 [Rhodobacterales bacterium]|nr:MAG: hypothetical protein CSA70_03215 [Rhodobacterales bacterium]
MPAATNKIDLLEVTQREFSKLETLIQGIPDPLAQQAGPDNGPSIRETIGHRAHWIGLFLGWYKDGQAGREVAFPAPGYKWNQLPAYNAALRREQAGMQWSEARQRLLNAHEQLVLWIHGMDECALYGGPMAGARNSWTPGRWAEASGPSHYRSAAKYIRSILRGQTDQKA